MVELDLDGEEGRFGSAVEGGDVVDVDGGGIAGDVGAGSVGVGNSAGGRGSHLVESHVSLRPIW